MAKFGFDSSDVDVNAQVTYELMPEGEYTLKCLEAEEKTTSAGTGSYIAAKFEVVKGDYAGRYVWQNFNIHNPSEKAQNIGRQQLVAWATAAGKPEASDTDQLLDRSFQCSIGVEAGKNGYSDRNKIMAFLFAKEEKAKPAAAPKSTPKPAAPAKNSGNPWD